MKLKWQVKTKEALEMAIGVKAALNVFCERRPFILCFSQGIQHYSLLPILQSPFLFPYTTAKRPHTKCQSHSGPRNLSTITSVADVSCDVTPISRSKRERLPGQVWPPPIT
jgi:hypothetical protein